MISSQKYRATIQITLADIFLDFNDPRKELLMKRVKIALDDLEIRMRSELESNNLANLQMLLKKQQTLKKMEEKLNEITQEIEEKRERDTYLNHRVSELQAEVKKKSDLLQQAEDKIKLLADSSKRLESQLSGKEQELRQTHKEKSVLQKQNQAIQMEKQKHEETIFKLRNTFIHKVEEAEFMLKIKEQKLAESFHQSLSNIQIKNIREKEKQELEIKRKTSKVEKKNQKIQVNLSNPPPSSRLREHQNTSRLQVKSKEDKEVQTEVTQEKKISQFISNTPQKKEEKLEQIRLIYSTTPPALQTLSEENEEQEEEIKVESPKIVKLFAPEISSTHVQTDHVTFKPPTPIKFEQICQVEPDDESETAKSIRAELQELKIQYKRMEELHENRYWQIVRIYEQRPSQESDLREIEVLKLNILELQLQIERKEKEIVSVRELFTRFNHDLEQSQNHSLMKKLNIKLGEPIQTKPSKFNKTCSIFFSNSPKRVQTYLSDPNNEEMEEHNDMHATYYTSKLKRPTTDDDIITVTKSKNTLKYSQHRRHSLKSETAYTQFKRLKPKIGQDYQKYSKVKQCSYFQ